MRETCTRTQWSRRARSRRDYPATRWLRLAVVSAAQFLAAFDLWVVTIALPTLRREFAPAELSDVHVVAMFAPNQQRVAEALGDQ